MRIARTLALVLVLLITAPAFVMAGGQADDTQDTTTLTIFVGEHINDYPEEGTRIGNIIKENTGVNFEFEFLVGELETKAGIMLAGGDVPDLINARAEQSKFRDQGYLIPLEDLIAEHAPNLQALYGPYMNRLKAPDGHIYTLPDLAPVGDAPYTSADKGWWVQKRVLEWADYPMIKTLDQYFDLIQSYMEAHPDNDDIGFLPLTYSWYKDYLYSAANVLSGYGGEGQGLVDYVNGEWVFNNYFGSDLEKRFYTRFNQAFQAGLVDPEGFVATLDDYKAKLATGKVLGIYDETWIFQDVQNILKDEQPDSMYVAFPVTFDGGSDQYHAALSLASGMGTSITTACEDPVAAIQFLDYIASSEAQRLIYWGEEGVDYTVTEEGRLIRTAETRAKSETNNFIQKEFGGEYYFEYLPGMVGTYENGNTVRPQAQPEEFFAIVTDVEKEVLAEYDVKTFYEMFTPAKAGADRSVYQPLWSLRAEQGSDFDIVNTKIGKLREMYCSKMLSAADDAEFASLWAEYTAELSNIDLDVYVNFYQENIDLRVRQANNME